MRVLSVAKAMLLAAAVALPSVASAKAMKVAPGSCAFGNKGVVANSAACSYNCNPQTKWCAQQLCVNGSFNQLLPCYTGFCTAKCGG